MAGHGQRNLIVIRLVKEFYCMCDRFALPLVTATFWPNLIFASTFVCLATRKFTCIQQPVEVNFLNVSGMARPHEGFGSFHISLICNFPGAAAVSDCYKGFLSMLLLPEIFAASLATQWPNSERLARPQATRFLHAEALAAGEKP